MRKDVIFCLANSCHSVFIVEVKHIFHVVLVFVEKTSKMYDSIFWKGFNCLKATESLRGNSLLFTSQFPEVPGAQLMKLGRMKG